MGKAAILGHLPGTLGWRSIPTALLQQHLVCVGLFGIDGLEECPDGRVGVPDHSRELAVEAISVVVRLVEATGATRSTRFQERDGKRAGLVLWTALDCAALRCALLCCAALGYAD